MSVMASQIDYDEITVGRMKNFAERLDEKDRRAYAAVEAYKIGYGGVTFIAELFGMCPETIKRGQRDLDDPDRLPATGRQRQVGAGRKGLLVEQPGLEEAFNELIENRIAGDPMNADVKWTDLQPLDIATKLNDRGFEIGDNTVRILLENAISGNEVQ